MRITVCCLCAWLALLSTAQAQTPCTTPTPQTNPPTYTCPTGSARTLLFDWTETAQPGDVFRLFVNGAQVGADMPARTASGWIPPISARDQRTRRRHQVC